MKNKSLIIAPPIPPKLIPQLDNWSGPVLPELEISNSLIDSENFSVVQRLELESCKVTALQLTGASLKKLQLSDAILSRIEAAGLRAPGGSCLRTIFKDSRLTGADFGESLLEDCLFQNVKLDEAGLRFITMKRVRFENCILRGADFSSAKLSNVSFTGCDLEAANFDSTTCSSVDVRGEALGSIKGVHGLKGARISSEQLIQLAPLLAAEVGLDVDYET